MNFKKLSETLMICSFAVDQMLLTEMNKNWIVPDIEI